MLAMWAEENDFDAPGAVWGIAGRVAAVWLADGLRIRGRRSHMIFCSVMILIVRFTCSNVQRRKEKVRKGEVWGCKVSHQAWSQSVRRSS